jgi:hypothetical protein
MRCSAQWRFDEVVRLTAAGAAPEWFKRVLTLNVTGFPFHPDQEFNRGTRNGEILHFGECTCNKIESMHFDHSHCLGVEDRVDFRLHD